MKNKDEITFSQEPNKQYICDQIWHGDSRSNAKQMNTAQKDVISKCDLCGAKD